MVNKIPALVDLLIYKTKYWEDERTEVFLYDEVPLLAMLEDYNMLRKEREDEKQRQREHKKTQSKVVTEHESPFGPRPGTSSRHISDKSSNGSFQTETPPNRRLPMGSPTRGISFRQEGRKKHRERIYTQKGFAYHPREDTLSIVSSYSGPFSP